VFEFLSIFNGEESSTPKEQPAKVVMPGVNFMAKHSRFAKSNVL
jgi:hypothetical protein